MYRGEKIADSRSLVMMTGQIFFSLDKPRFWPRSSHGKSLKVKSEEKILFKVSRFRKWNTHTVQQTLGITKKI